MDFEGSLTPPMSPGLLMDSEPFVTTSPVLLGKHRGNRSGLEDSLEFVQNYTEYPDPLSCNTSIFGNSYEVEEHKEQTIIGDAFSYWNKCVIHAAIPEFPHECEENWRYVLGEKRCLHELADSDQAEDIVYGALMYFQDLENNAKIWMKSNSSNNSHHVTVGKKYRKLINEALCFLCEYVQHGGGKDNKNQDSFIKILNLLAMMRNQTQVVLQDGVKGIVREDVEKIEIGSRLKSTPVKEWLHVYMDVQTSLLKILPVLSKLQFVAKHMDSMQIFFNNGIEVLDQELLWKMIRSILSDMIKLAIEKYNQLLFSAKNDKGQFLQSVLFTTSPFSCLCIQQLLSLSFHTAAKICNERTVLGDMDSMETQSNRLDYSHDNVKFKLIAAQFWKICLTFINTIIQNAQSKHQKEGSQSTNGPKFPNLDSDQDALSFAWWFTWHISHLFLYDSSGNYKIDCAYSTSYLPLLSRLLRMSLTSCTTDSKLLASHLICYQALSSFWCKTSSYVTVTSAELAPFHLLWAHFSRKLNVNKKQDKIGIHKYTSNDEKISPQIWLSKCEKYLSHSKTSLADDAQIIYDDAFDIFLSIFGGLLNIGCWSQLKDRFYSRLLPNEIKNLTETGMSRLFQLFILIALSSENNDSQKLIFTKLLEYLNSAYLGKTDYRKQKVMLSGLFACMYISIRNSMKMTEIATKCGKMMSLIFKIFADTEKNMEQRNSLWKIISFYFRNLTEVCQTSQSFHLDQYLIVPVYGLVMALSKTRSSEQLVVLEMLSAVFSTISSQLKHSTNKESLNGSVKLYQSIVKQCYLWLKDMSKFEENYCEEIVNVVLEICRLTLQIKEVSTDPQPFTLSNIVEYFGSSMIVKLQTRFLFLVGILSDETKKILCFLNCNNPESDGCRDLLVQGCLKCIILHPHENDRTHIVTSLARLDKIDEIFRSSEENFTTTTMLCFGKFLCQLGARYNSSKTFMERKDRKEQAAGWFNPLSDIFQAFAKTYKTEDREKVTSIFESCGQVVQHCSKLLYAPGKSGFLTQVFDMLILPRWIYISSEKNLSQTMLKALHQTLHMYFHGLLQLDYKLDNYVQRVMNDIFTIYFLRFPAATNAKLHPICRVLLNDTITSVQRSTVIKLMKEFCQIGGNTETRLTMVIEILHSWSESITEVACEEKLQLCPILDKAKSILHAFPSLMTKIHFISSLC